MKNNHMPIWFPFIENHGAKKKKRKGLFSLKVPIFPNTLLEYFGRLAEKSVMDLFPMLMQSCQDVY